MKTGKSNRIPQWALFFAVLLGIPTIAALLRAGFERGFHKPTALMLTAVFLSIFGLLLHRKFMADSLRGPLSREEKKLEGRQLQFGITLLLAAIFLIGAGLFIWCGFQPSAEWPSSSKWLLCIAAFIIGGISLLMGVGFVLRLCTLLAGKGYLKLEKSKMDQ